MIAHAFRAPVAAGCTLIALAALCAAPVGAQVRTITVRVETEAGEPIEGARVRTAAAASLTDESGEASLALPLGAHALGVDRIGFASASLVIDVGPTGPDRWTVVLEEEALEVEEIIVTSTRADRRIEDEPLRVEVVGREEVEEKLLMTPGDIAMLLNETAGLRVQPTAPSLGGASVRIQGLRGRYALILSDGLPLYGGQSAALGPLQIPPMDLAQVEVIKGAASALYGSSALGGVINLVSRRPERARELLLNQTGLGGTDALLWLSDEMGTSWGYTLLAGGHRQPQADVDDDGWADLAGYRRVAVRPRLFWSGERGNSLLATVGGMVEDREGGTVSGGTTPAGTPYLEEQETRRIDAGLLARVVTRGDEILTLRGSGSLLAHRHGYGPAIESDRHATAFTEATLAGARGDHTWVLGGALQADLLRADDVAGFDYTHAVASLFAQDELALSSVFLVSASARLDAHDEYGVRANPRVSVLLRPGDWTLRASAGTGTFAPTPFTEEVEAVGLGRVAPLPVDLRVERARTASIDVGREVGPLELNATLFGSVIDDPLRATPNGTGLLALANAQGPVRTSGAELLARYEREPLHVIATYVLTRSREDAPGGGRREVPLTPRHTAGLVVAWEAEGRGRVGFELYHTGRQELEDDPYGVASRPYWVTGVLGEWRVGAARLFLNAENLLDARQTRWAPLVRPTITTEGRWTTDAWAPLEGRVFNAGVRLSW